MQNFTLGKRGLPMLLFALILLTTSFSSFGQENCPTLNDTSPEDFCYLQTIQDLTTATGATVTTGTVAWYRDENSTNPIPNGELLQNGNYFAGNTNGNCTGSSRIEVTVSVINVGAPTPSFGSFFQPCEYGPSDVSTVQDLINMVDPSETTYVIEVFDEEFTGNPLPAGQQLEVGENYFVGQRDPNATPSCPSTRVAIEYSPVLAIAPTGDSEQIFCEGATVADLTAEPTSANTQGYRWYSTLTSNPALDPSTPLVNGETYYASQIVNRTGRNQPPCESIDRFEVRAIVQGPIDFGTPEPGIICETEVEAFPSFDAIEDYLFSLIPGVDPSGTFSPTAEELSAQYSGPGDYTITYTVGADGCESSVELTVTVIPEETANAGTIENIVLDCSDDAVVILDDTILIGDATTGGNFTGQGVNAEGNFDPTLVGPGTYTITYSVDDTADCVIAGTVDSTTFTITVQGTPGEPQIVTGEICQTEVEAFADLEAVSDYLFSLLPGVDQNGTFDPTIQELVGLYNGPGEYVVTYTVGDNCDSSYEITVTVTPEEPAEAGTIENRVLNCGDNAVVVLDDLLSNDASTGGTFTGEGINGDGNFDPSTVGPGTYTITYSVDDTADCVTAGTVDSTTFTITVQGTSGEPQIVTGEICQTEVEAFADLEAVSDYLFSLLPGVDQNGTFDPTIQELVGLYNGPGEYVVTYTVGDNCDSSYEITVTVTPEEPAEAGTIENRVLNCGDNAVVVLDDLLSNDASTGGTFTGEGINGDGNFDPSTVGPGTYTITYSVDDTADCVTAGTVDSTTFTISVQGTSGEPQMVTGVICETEVDAFPDLEAIEDYLFSLMPGVDQNGIFDPTIQELVGLYSGPGEYVITYTVGDDCDSSYEITVTVIPEEAAEAGTIANITVDCGDEEVVILDDSLLSGDATTGGTFSGEGVNEDGNFDPSVGPGNYTITYSVDDTADCVTPGTSDSTTFTITVNGTSTVGPIDLGEMCITEAIALLDDPTAAIAMYYDELEEREIPLDGTFSPALAVVGAQIINYINTPTSASQLFQTTYTVTTSCGEESVLISLTINNTTDAEAGTIGNITVSCDNAGMVMLNDSLLSEEATTGGTFSGEGINEDGNFDPSVGPGTYTITYSVDDSANCVTPGTSDSTTFTITVQGTSGEPVVVTGSICEAEVAAFPDFESIRNYLFSLMPGVPQNGTFDPTAEELVGLYSGAGEYVITYTLGDDCDSSYEITVIVTPEETANAGPDTTVTFCSSEGAFDLTSFLNAGANQNGFFAGLENNMFNPSQAGVGSFTYTYTVDSSASCVEGEDTATYTVVVTQGEVSAGPDNSDVVCNADVRNLSPNGVRNLYFGLLGQGVPRNGTFTPTIAQLIDQYNIVGNYGDFTTTYTVGNGECQDSAVLTITVLEANDAGEDMNLTFCSTDAAVNLFDYLSPFATTTGTFQGYADGMFNPATATIGETTITYAVEEDDSECTNNNFTSTFTITVTAPEAANAGGDVSVTYCIDQNEDIQLTSILGEGALTTGDFSAPYANGVFNPSTAGLGEYVITYTVDEDDCATGTDTATITITVRGTADAPVAEANQSFCDVDEPTVADLEATGEGLIWYTDADLTIPATQTTALNHQDVFYVVSSTGDSACETSEAVMVTVTLNTAVSPTIGEGGNEFCRQDNPTVQDLIDNLSGNGIRIYTSVTGGTPLAATESLQDNAIYYATATNATSGCESSERRQVQVEVQFCGIPEGFSPNGDGINDRFVIEDIAEDYPNYTIEIFNRWGNAVFKGNRNTPDWDGVSNQSTTLGDKILPAGVYFYIVNYNDGSTPPAQGKLYLSR